MWVATTSGRYELINLAGSSEEREVTSTKGEHFPLTPESGMHYKLVDLTHHKNQKVLNQQENDITTTSENQQLYKPGEIVPESGQYELINPDGSSEGREVTSTCMRTLSANTRIWDALQASRSNSTQKVMSELIDHPLVLAPVSVCALLVVLWVMRGWQERQYNLSGTDANR